MGELTFAKPINTAQGDRYGSRGGTHKGIDYLASEGTSVIASESGLVVRAAENSKEPDRPRAYGNVIVIYHNPGAADSGKPKDRHIYTLYAHLVEIYVKAGDYVEKYETIGAAGNTGTVKSSKGGEGFHLHFEVIESEGEKDWSSGKGAMGVEGGVDRKDPERYFNQPKEVEGTLPDMVEQAIMNRVEFVPDIDLKRNDPFQLQAWLDGKNIGYVNKYNDAFTTNIKYDLKEELKKLKTWRKPLQVPKSEPIKLEYEIKLR